MTAIVRNRPRRRRPAQLGATLPHDGRHSRHLLKLVTPAWQHGGAWEDDVN
jgi:hypothetical protein